MIYSEGATGYLAQTGRGATLNMWRGNTVGYGFWEDAVYTVPGGVTNGQIQQTTGWSAFASYEHFWTPSLRTSLYGTYVELSHNANARTAICVNDSARGSSAFFGATCNPDWSAYAIGSRSQWNITSGLYVGLDVIYLHLNSASPNAANVVPLNANSGAKPGTAAGVLYNVQDKDAVAATWRIHRDIVP